MKYVNRLITFKSISQKKHHCCFCNKDVMNLKNHLKIDHNLTFLEALLLINDITLEDIPECPICNNGKCVITIPGKNISVNESGYILGRCNSKKCKNIYKNQLQKLTMTEDIDSSGKTAWDRKYEVTKNSLDNNTVNYQGRVITSREMSTITRLKNLKSVVEYDGKLMTKGRMVALKAISTKRSNPKLWDETLDTLLRTKGTHRTRLYNGTNLVYYSNYELDWLREFDRLNNGLITDYVRNGCECRIYNYFNGRTYTPDYFIPSTNTVVEIKSSYWLRNTLETVKQKFIKCIELGYEVEFVLDKVHKYKFNSIDEVELFISSYESQSRNYEMNPQKQYDFYLASPLFCKEDNEVLDRVEDTLDKLGITYFSPRKDSNIGGDLRAAKTPEEKDAIAQRIFELNETAIHSSKMVLVNTVGTRFNNAIYGDQGTLIEAGLAFGSNIPVVTYNFLKYGLNIMLSQKSVHHFDSLTLDEYTQLNLLKDILNEYNNYSEDYPADLICSELRHKFWETKDRELV